VLYAAVAAVPPVSSSPAPMLLAASKIAASSSRCLYRRSKLRNSRSACRNAIRRNSRLDMTGRRFR